MTPWTAALQAPLSSAFCQSLLRFITIESVKLFNHLFLCCSLLLLPSVLPSIRVFSNKLPLHIRQPKYWSFSFSISPSNEYSRSISFRIGLVSLQSKGLSRVLSSVKFKSINSSALTLLHGPTLTCIHDYWKNHINLSLQ